MILVAFVLVLVATVTLIIGTFFDAGVAYIWISIAACFATFVVLGISYLARRRSADEPAARPAPLAARDSRTATTRTASRGTTLGDSAGPVREETPSTASDEDTSVTIVTARDRDEPTWPTEAEAAASEQPVADAPAAEEEPAAAGPTTGEPAADESAADEPAPRRVAPRRVVRRAPVTPAAGTAGEQPAGEQPAGDQPAGEQPAGEQPAGEEPAETEAAPAAGAPAAEAPAPPAGRAPVRRVVRRPAGEGGTTRKVVRRAGTPAAGQRRVQRVVRRADQDGATAATTRTPPPADAPAKEASDTGKATGGRTGTRGKRARAALSEIKGVGPAKQDALLKRFGSLENMASASIDELTSVKGVGPNVANEIKQALSKG